MSRLRVAPIVEGDGEVACVPILLKRIWYELPGGGYIDVLKPTRAKRDLLVKAGEIEKSVHMASGKLGNPPESSDPALVLILILSDADDDCPGALGPSLLDRARKVCPPEIDVARVPAKYEYETWFAAAAESLSVPLGLATDFRASEVPEESRLRKAWVIRHDRAQGKNHSETVDQSKMTCAMDLVLCRKRSPSFDKLCREFARRLPMNQANG
jgi:hypothetical protein